MRPTIRGFLLLAAISSCAHAASLCATATMAVYTTPNFSCFISDKLFSNFLYSSTADGNGIAVASTNVTVTPDFSDPNNPGFHFSSNGWLAVSHATDTFDTFVDSSISFSVATLSGQPLIDDNTLSLDSFFVSGAPFTMFGDIAETLDNGTSYAVDTGGPFIDHKTFPLTSHLVVNKDLFVGAAGGFESVAQIFQFSENFSEIGAPEPVSFVLFGCGLLGVGILRRRRS